MFSFVLCNMPLPETRGSKVFWLVNNNQFYAGLPSNAVKRELRFEFGSPEEKIDRMEKNDQGLCHISEVLKLQFML